MLNTIDTSKSVWVPSELVVPAFCMNFPFTVDNRSKNNALMKDKSPYNYDRAFRQWMKLYTAIASEGLVYLLPHNNEDLQDLPYVANLGSIIPTEPNQFLLSNFKSKPRQGEEPVGKEFFDNLGYNVHQPPHFFEGEADLKYIRDNIFIAGYGIRSNPSAYDWMQDNFDMDIIQIKMDDEKLYHFDCMFFPLTEEKAIVATSELSTSDISQIERVVEIIDVPREYVYDGWTNLINLNDRIIANVPPTPESRDDLEDLIADLGYEPVLINLSEFDKSGSDGSCFVMHLNFNGRK